MGQKVKLWLEKDRGSFKTPPPHLHHTEGSEGKVQRMLAPVPGARARAEMGPKSPGVRLPGASPARCRQDTGLLPCTSSLLAAAGPGGCPETGVTRPGPTVSAAQAGSPRLAGPWPVKRPQLWRPPRLQGRRQPVTSPAEGPSQAWQPLPERHPGAQLSP